MRLNQSITQMKYNFEIKGEIGYGYGSKGWVSMQLENNKGKHVDVRVNSLGGSVDAALDIAARFREHGDVTVYMRGMNASAATILAMGAKKVVTDGESLMLIHNCLNVVWELGWMNANEIEEAIKRMRLQQEDQANIDRVIATMYANKTGKTFDEIKKVMDRGTWLSADECKQLGLVDEIDGIGQSHKAMVAARADFGSLQQAYGLPALPELNLAQRLQDKALTFNENMKDFFNKVLALLGIEAIASADGTDATAEQMQTALDSATAAVKDLKDKKEQAETSLATANKTIESLNATIAQMKTDAEKAAATAKEVAEAAQKAAEKAKEDAVAAATAELQKTIDAQKAQIEALKAAPGAQQQEPAGQEGEQAQKQDAFSLYESVKDML